MESKFSRWKKRSKSDSGNGILIMSLAIFGLILLLGILFIDITKNTWLSNSYTQYAQRAAQNGLKEQNNIGGLTPKAAESVVREYLAERNSTGGQTNETVPFRYNCANKYGDDPEITVEFSTTRDNKGKQFTSTFKYKDGQFSPPIDGNYPEFYRNSYKTIKIKVKDYGDNSFKSMFGEPCSVYTIQASAIAIDANAGDTGK